MIIEFDGGQRLKKLRGLPFRAQINGGQVEEIKIGWRLHGENANDKIWKSQNMRRCMNTLMRYVQEFVQANQLEAAIESGRFTVTQEW